MSISAGPVRRISGGRVRRGPVATLGTETLALFQTGAAKALAVVQSLSDDQLATSGTVFTDAPPMTAEQLIMLGLVGHIDDHMGSIRKTVGM